MASTFGLAPTSSSTTSMRQEGSDNEFSPAPADAPLQDWYSDNVLPQEKLKLAQALGQLRSAFGQQAAASRGRNLDLSRRLGMGGGQSSAFQNALSAGLSRGLGNALARRRAAFQDEIQAFRAAEMGREVASRQMNVADAQAGQARMQSIMGAIAGGIGAIGGGAQAVAALSGGLQGATGSTTDQFLSAEAAEIARQQSNFSGRDFGSSAGERGNPAGVDFSQLGARLGQGQGGAMLLPEDQDDSDWGW